MNNNTAVVCKLGNIQKIEGADKIVQASVLLEGIPIASIVVGSTTVEGELVVYFDSNLAIEQGVIDVLDRLDPTYGSENFRGMGGYLAKGNRVRCIKLKGTISNGLAVNVDRFSWIFPGVSSTLLVDGYSFTSLEGVEICHKYVSPIQKAATQPTGKKGKKEKPGTTIIEGHFPEHIDTDQLIRNIHRINPNDVIQISEKWHGTSSRTGNVLTTRKLSFIEKLLTKFGVEINATEYNYVYGSRRVTKKIDGKENVRDKNHFYSSDLWTKVGEEQFKGKLAKGEIVYYEIVGYTPDGSPIQKIGKNVYNYGAEPKQYKIYVYRVTLTNEDGYTTEYSTQAVKDRCREWNVPSVKELYYGRADDFPAMLSCAVDWHNQFLKALQISYLEKYRIDCVNPKTWDEGIVIRRECGGIDAFKLKSLNFLNSESDSANEDKVVDMEEQV